MHPAHPSALRPLFVLVALALAGCGEALAPAAPANEKVADQSDPPAFELYATADRIDPSYINAHVYGSFRISATLEGAAAVITSGPANFPGHPAAGSGTCESGTWINANGRRTAGTMDRPHPHCLQSTSTMEVVLEPISACYTVFGMHTQRDCLEPLPVVGNAVHALLAFGAGVSKAGPVVIGLLGTTSKAPGESHTRPLGTSVTGYAIDASTLGTTNRRVGTLTIAMSEFQSTGTNILPVSFLEDCSMDASLTWPCINRVLTATYNPLPVPDGVGTADTVVEGFLWMAGSKVPYNY